MCSLYKAHVPGSHGLKGDHDFTPGDFRSEGDSPAFLHTIPTGLRNLESPDYGGWGGRFVKVRENTWLDPVPEPGYRYPEGRWFTETGWGRAYMRDRYPQDQHLMREYFKPLSQWVIPLQNDFAARADWCVKEFKDANHAPVVEVKEALDRTVKVGETMKLAAKATDPDGNKLACQWWQYADADSATSNVTIVNSDSWDDASFVAPNERGKQVHIILEVTDNGTPPLVRYQRIICDIQ